MPLFNSIIYVSFMYGKYFNWSLITCWMLWSAIKMYRIHWEINNHGPEIYCHVECESNAENYINFYVLSAVNTPNHGKLWTCEVQKVRFVDTSTQAAACFHQNTIQEHMLESPGYNANLLAIPCLSLKRFTRKAVTIIAELFSATKLMNISCWDLCPITSLTL